jgi:hypothetical protein
MALLSDPRVQGSMAATDHLGRWSYLPAEAEAHLRSLGYENRGRLTDMMMDELEHILAAEDAK